MNPARVQLTFAAVIAFSTSGACNGRDGFDPSSEAPFPESPDAGDGCRGKVQCSRNLQAVVDACDESRVVTACPPDEGCADGKCVAACSAAVASAGSIGCEFAAVPPAGSGPNAGSCFAAFFTNTWPTATTLEADHAGTPLDLSKAARIVHTEGGRVTYEPFTGKIEPGEAAVVFLSQSHPTSPYWIGCPEGVTPGVVGVTATSGTARGASFRIKTSAPVSAYSIYPFGGADSYFPSATLLLPVAAWKTGYVVADAWESLPSDGQHLPTIPQHPTIQIVAAEDETKVTVTGNVDVQPGIDVEGAARGAAQVYSLKRGELLQFVQADELTGSRVSANKNIAVFGGHECMQVPTSQPACDTSQLQLFPVRSWGREYVAVPYQSRRDREVPERYYYRVVAAAEGTKLTYEPERPADAPPTLSAGATAVFTSREPFVVRSQDADHPISVYAYMSGAIAEDARSSDGDPEFTAVIPSEQYLGRYVFFVDPTYRNAQIVVVRSRAAGGEFKPVTLDCAGHLEGWKPVGSEGKYEYVRLFLRQRDVNQSIGTGTCGPGRREIDSAGPVSVTVWGTDWFSSYAYPGGAALRTVNTVDPDVR